MMINISGAKIEVERNRIITKGKNIERKKDNNKWKRQLDREDTIVKILIANKVREKDTKERE